MNQKILSKMLLTFVIIVMSLATNYGLRSWTASPEDEFLLITKLFYVFERVSHFTFLLSYINYTK
jgi:hypothetical protein